MQDKATAIHDDINVRIASRVRTLRFELGLSLDALAARCGVSRSMLSLVERGESSPTAVVLDKIATGLGVPLARLFEDVSAPASPVSRRGDRETWRDPQSGYLRRNISPANYPSALRIVEVTFPPGAKIEYDAPPHPVEIHQQIWVQEGTLEVTLGNVLHRLSQDDCLVMRADEPTAFRNRTRKAARYILVVTSEKKY